MFGDRPQPIPVVTAKSHMGNPGAACGVLEVMASLLALEQGELFPVLNYETPDPDCPVAVVRDRGVAAGDVFVNVNVTPQGQASSLAVGRFAG